MCQCPCSEMSAHGKPWARQRRREKVAAWLKMLENNGVRCPASDPNGGLQPQLDGAELGIERLRR